MEDILIVDDEYLYQQLLRINLQREGYNVSAASDGLEALELLGKKEFSLIILDIMMPRLDGITTCERIRQFSNTPIIVLTARGDERDRVRGLNAGADDYVVKPFSADELLARVRAVLRRTQPMEPSPQTRFFSHGNLKIDLISAEVWKDEKPVYLSVTEYKLLIQFAHHIGEVLTPRFLLNEIWGPHYQEEKDKEILWVSIARLRQKLENDPHNPAHILTRSGHGYFMPPLENGV
jgi:DNA-binding response OmpR family regulator